MDPLKLFIPIVKIDVAQRLVYGVATAEEEDRSGEICDYASTKPYYEAWSGAIHKATGGKSLGNVRAMHGKVAAGKVTTINFNDAGKKIEVCSKIVDDGEWKKVEEGVYTGFSQGGAYIKRWRDDAGKQRYTANPTEISLVDLPCLASATFEVIKADGAHEARHFRPVVAEPTNDAVAAKATELAKAAGAEARWPDYVDQARAELNKAALPVNTSAPEPDISAGKVDTSAAKPTEGDEWEQVWKSKRDGASFKTKAELRKHHETLDAAAAAQATAGLTLDALANIEAALGKREVPVPEARSRPRATEPDLKKSLYIASSFAEILANLRGIAASTAYDSLFSQDGTDAAFAGQMKAWVAQGCALLVSIIQNEIDGLADAGEVVMLEAAAGLSPNHFGALTKMVEGDAKLVALAPVLAKAGRRNSKADQDKIQAMHDHASDLGAKCEAKGDTADKAAAGDLAKVAGDPAKTAEDLEKVTGERDALRKTLDGLQPRLDAILKSVHAIEAQPVPPPVTRTISKAEDTGGIAPELAALVNDPQALSLALIKLAQTQGQPLIQRR